MAKDVRTKKNKKIKKSEEIKTETRHKTKHKTGNQKKRTGGSGLRLADKIWEI